MFGTLLFYFFAIPQEPSSLCNRWATNSAQQWSLPRSWLDEASGIARSQFDPLLTYHVNDSDRALNVVSFNAQLTPPKIQQWRISATKAYDLEDLTQGACPHLKERSCLVFADTGDNRRRRKIMRLRFVPEPRELKDRRAWQGPEHELIVTLPDGARDIEAVAQHPLTHDIYFLSKHFDLSSPLEKKDPELFLLARGEQHKSRAQLKKIAVLPVSKILASGSYFSQLPTSMDFHPSGEKLAILTYGFILELKTSALNKLPSKELQQSEDYVIQPLAPGLPQAEALVYSSQGDALWISSEAQIILGVPEPPLHKYSCAR